MSSEEKRTELNQCPLLDQVTYRLTNSADKQARIDKLVEMTNKRLEQQLIAEVLLKPTGESVYNIDKSRIRTHHGWK